jgi:hypothetical protein
MSNSFLGNTFDQDNAMAGGGDTSVDGEVLDDAEKFDKFSAASCAQVPGTHGQLMGRWCFTGGG